jgi:sec-independent protein translocase protein TatA
MMFGGVGVQELLLIFLVVLLLFGAKRIPDIAHGLGKGVREFKRAMQETQDELNRSISDTDKNEPAPPAGAKGQESAGNKPPASA